MIRSSLAFQKRRKGRIKKKEDKKQTKQQLVRKALKKGFHMESGSAQKNNKITHKRNTSTSSNIRGLNGDGI